MPTAVEYLDAIRNPRICFRGLDNDLSAASPKITISNPTRPPMSWCGQFAIVFCLSEGNHTWAIKCFTGNVPGRQRHYREISNYLKSHGIPVFVDFEYKQDCIRIRGNTYPIVKMGWVEGKRLDQYIDSCLNQRPPNVRAIESLCQKWIELAEILKSSKIAHGDLQHGNVFVLPNGELRLVDYDGMYIPKFRGENQREWGMAGYQHKDRDKAPFDEKLDRFSFWVIYVTLRALAVEPTLWIRYRPGDNHLCFTEKDLNPTIAHGPVGSKIFQELKRSTNPDIRKLSETLEKAAIDSYNGIPDFPPPGYATHIRSCRYGHPVIGTQDYCEFGHPDKDRKFVRCPNIKKEVKRWVILGSPMLILCNFNENLNSHTFCMNCGYDLKKNPRKLNVTCPECYEIVSLDADFCSKGHVQPPYKKCPKCKTINRKNFMNCSKCGESLWAK